MAIGPKGDRSGVSAGECAVRLARYFCTENYNLSRMAKAGANIVGANCLFDPWINLETVRKMKVALDAFNMSPFLMSQTNAYRCPDCGPFGWLSLPEFPYGWSPLTQSPTLILPPAAIEPRQITRYEAKQWAREAYNLGIR